MKKAALLSALLVGTALVAVAPASAEPGDHAHFHHVIAHPGHPGFHPRPAFRNHFVLRHDFRHFTVGEHRWWAGGHWRHTRWHGRFGWWWNIGPSWYFYDAPAYPYPGYVSETSYDDQDYDDGDQGGYDDQGGPGGDQGGPGGDQGGYDQQQGGGNYGGPGGGYGGGMWYHCSQPEGYYPYVKNCRNWQQVPAQPNDMGPGPGGGPNDGPPGYDGGDQGPPPRH